MSRTRRIALAAILALLLAAVLLGKFWLTFLGSALVQAEPPIHAPVAIVLAGDYTGNRIRRAADLVRQGFVPQVLVSGPGPQYGEYECDMAIRYITRLGYPAAWFVPLPHHATSTMEEARLIVDRLRQLGVTRADIVTSDYHTHRSALDFRGLHSGIDFRFVAAPDDNFTADGWWRTREGRKTFLLEWMKTVATWFGV